MTEELDVLEVPAALAEIRGKLLSLTAEAEKVRRAALPAEEVRSPLLKRLKGIVLDRGAGLPFRTAAAGRGLILQTNDPLTLADLAWIIGTDTLTDMIMERLKDDGPVPGLPAAKRSARLTELNAERLLLERAEELEILKLQKAGHAVLRRADADPALLLLIWAELDKGARK